MAFVLDTADIPARDRAEAVYAAMLHASAPCHVVHEDPTGRIHARMELWDLGRGANVFTHRSSGIRLLRTPRQARQDAMPVIALSVQRRAVGRLEQRTRRHTAEPGELLAVDLSAPYDYAWSGDGAAGCVQIPLDQLGVSVDVIRRATAHLRASPLYRLVTDHVANLASDPAGITTGAAAEAVTTATIDLARALLASAGGADRRSREVLADTLLSRVRAYVLRHLADPDLRPATIAAAHHVSLRHLYKLCADAELSLEQWIIAERLAAARRDLLHPAGDRLPVAVVARRWGFRDPTHFTRRYKARYGTLPSQRHPTDR